MVACEDTLSNYSRAVDFFTAICNMTSGVMMPLTTADLLAMTIVGSVLENMDMERLIAGKLSMISPADAGRDRARGRGAHQGEGREHAERRGGGPVRPCPSGTQAEDELTPRRELHERLLLRNEQTKQVQLPDVYIQTDNSRKNVLTWMNAGTIGEAAPQILPVAGRRLTDKFRRNNIAHGFRYTPGGRLPPRTGAGAGAGTSRASASASGDASPSSPDKAPGALSSSPPATGGAGAGAGSPGRRIVADFKPFGGAAGASVFGAPMVPTGPGGGMFGAAGRTPLANAAMRGQAHADDDDDDDEDGTQLRREAISLDQARRIATQSVFRAGRLPI